MVIPFESPGATTDTLVPVPSDDPVERWLDRVTRRLGIDRELQIEVRQELRSHLEESAAELRRAGRNATDARDEALRALGDEDELADALWRANRRRVRLRALGAWTARLVFPAAVAGLVAFLAYGALVAAWMVNPRVFAFYVGSRSGDAAERYRSAALADAPPEVKLLFEQGDAVWGEQELGIARRLVDLKPDDPALYANYAMAVSRHSVASQVGVPEPSHPHNEAPPEVARPPLVYEDRLSAALAVYAEGERREPGNALYPALAAAALFEVSSASVPDESLDLQRPGKEHERGWERQVVFDAPRHAEALAAVRRAAAAPYFRTYGAELASRKAAALPGARVADVWLRGRAEQSALIFAYRAGQPVRDAATYATALADTPGGPAQSEPLVRDLHLLAGKAAEAAQTTGEVHMAYWMARTAHAADARVRQAAGDVAGAERVWSELDAMRDQYQAVYAQSTHAANRLDDQAGLLYAGVLRDALRHGQADPAPMRRAEYATADQLCVAVVAAGLLAAAGVYALAAGVQWLRARRRTGHAPPRLFVGHKRLAWVVGVGAISPVVLYLGYAGIEPLSGRGDGLNATLGRVLVEYGLLTLTVLLLVVAMSRRAVMERMKELGVAPRGVGEPLPAWRRTAAVAALGAGALCLAAVLVLATGMFREISHHTAGRAVPPLLAIGWVSIACAAGLVLWRGPRARGGKVESVMAGAVARSAFPVVMTAALVVALAGLPLRRVEAEHVAAVVGDGPLVSEKVVGESGYEAIRAELVREYDVVRSRAAEAPR